MTAQTILNARVAVALLLLSATVWTLGADRVQAADVLPVPRQAQPQPPTRPLLYYFEHFSLRRAAFLYEREIQTLIAHPLQVGDPVARLFTKATVYAAGVPTFDSSTVTGDMTRFIGQVNFETIRRGGYAIHVLRMPSPEHAPEAYFVAIVYKEGELLVEGSTAPSTRYLTLEKTSVDGKVFAVGEWDTNDRHRTHGFGDHEPTIEDVTENVFALLGIGAI